MSTTTAVLQSTLFPLADADVQPSRHLSVTAWSAGAGTAESPSVHFSAATDDWATPDDVFATLDAEFGFTLDVCASDENAKCTRYYTAVEDGLRQPWSGVVWCNPPYGNEIRRWIAMAEHCAARARATCVLLIPARTDTAWFHDYCTRASEVRFIRGRLKFGGAQYNAPFPSMVVVFRKSEVAR